VFVSRPGDPAVSSFDDPSLKVRKVGVQMIGDDGMNSPPAHALAERGVIDTVRGFPVYGDYRKDDPAADIVRAVADHEIDVAEVWGPVAGYSPSASRRPSSSRPSLTRGRPASPWFST
jgi:mxaJ protein